MQHKGANWVCVTLLSRLHLNIYVLNAEMLHQQGQKSTTAYLRASRQCPCDRLAVRALPIYRNDGHWWWQCFVAAVKAHTGACDILTTATWQTWRADRSCALKFWRDHGRSNAIWISHSGISRIVQYWKRATRPAFSPYYTSSILSFPSKLIRCHQREM